MPPVIPKLGINARAGLWCNRSLWEHRQGIYLIVVQSIYSQNGGMNLSTSLVLLLVVLHFPASSYAADSIPLGPAHPGVVHTRPDPARCNEYISKAQSVISDLPPSARNHRWVIVCSLDTWNYALHKAGAWGRTNTAFTNDSSKTTFINGAVFDEQEQFYRQTVYHEAGHIICRCSNEQRANLEAGRLLIAPSNASNPPVLGE
jgi:hypothetical protein